MEFVDEIIYATTPYGLKKFNTSTFELENVTVGNYSIGFSSIECGKTSGKLYLTSGNLTIVFDTINNSAISYDINDRAYHISIDKNEKIAYVGSHYCIYKLFLTNGTVIPWYLGKKYYDISNIIYQCPYEFSKLFLGSPNIRQ